MKKLVFLPLLLCVGCAKVGLPALATACDLAKQQVVVFEAACAAFPDSNNEFCLKLPEAKQQVEEYCGIFE